MPDVTGGAAIASAGAGIGSMLGGLFGGDSGDSGAEAAIQAAQIQANSARYSADLQKKMYDEAVARSQPWVNAGTSAVNEYAGLLKLPGYNAIDRTDYLRSTPGYQFQLGEGVNALDRSAAARGMLLSGPQAKAVTKYGQGLADTTYNSLMDRIYGLSNQGQSAAALTGNQGITSGQNIGNTLMSGANAQAQGLYNAYNARESAYGNQQKNIYGGLGALSNSLVKAAPYVSNWWNSPSSGTSSYNYPITDQNVYDYTNYYGGYE
jgi:hypothetical protein